MNNFIINNKCLMIHGSIKTPKPFNFAYKIHSLSPSPRRLSPINSARSSIKSPMNLHINLFKFNNKEMTRNYRFDPLLNKNGKYRSVLIEHKKFGNYHRSSGIEFVRNKNKIKNKIRLKEIKSNIQELILNCGNIEKSAKESKVLLDKHIKNIKKSIEDTEITMKFIHKDKYYIY